MENNIDEQANKKTPNPFLNLLNLGAKRNVVPSHINRSDSSEKEITLGINVSRYLSYLMMALHDVVGIVVKRYCS